MDASTLTLRLPLPPAALSPNARLHHMAKANAVADARELARCLAILGRGGWKPVLGARYRLTETYCIAGKRRHDLRNLMAAFKAYEDGLVDGEVLLGDDDTVIASVTGSIQRVGKGEEGVLVTIEEAK
jgi:hypothetical protein